MGETGEIGESLPMSTAIAALRRLYHTFTGRELPEANARRLLEQTKNETENRTET